MGHQGEMPGRCYLRGMVRSENGQRKVRIADKPHINAHGALFRMVWWEREEPIMRMIIAKVKL